MSSIVRFTPLQPIDGDEYVYTERNSHGAGVKITDFEGLKEELSSSLVGQMDTRKVVERDEYPGKEWVVLLGFTTYGDNGDGKPGTGADYHNVSNTDAKDLAELWETISEFTEPFVVYQTNFEGSWPHAASLLNTPGELYRVEARGGEATLEELTVTVTEQKEIEF